MEKEEGRGKKPKTKESVPLGKGGRREVEIADVVGSLRDFEATSFTFT